MSSYLTFEYYLWQVLTTYGIYWLFFSWGNPFYVGEDAPRKSWKTREDERGIPCIWKNVIYSVIYWINLLFRRQFLMLRLKFYVVLHELRMRFYVHFCSLRVCRLKKFCLANFIRFLRNCRQCASSSTFQININIFKGRLVLKHAMPARVIILIELHRISKLFNYP